MAEVGSIVVNLFAQVADHEQTKIGYVNVPVELYGSPFGNLDNVALTNTIITGAHIQIEANGSRTLIVDTQEVSEEDASRARTEHVELSYVPPRTKHAN